MAAATDTLHLTQQVSPRCYLSAQQTVADVAIHLTSAPTAAYIAAFLQKDPLLQRNCGMLCII